MPGGEPSPPPRRSSSVSRPKLPTPAGGLPPVSIEFGSVEWGEEVERYDRRSPARAQAQSARRTIEAGTAKRDWKRCKADGPGATKLPGCRKIYVPPGRPGASQ